MGAVPKVEALEETLCWLAEEVNAEAPKMASHHLRVWKTLQGGPSRHERGAGTGSHPQMIHFSSARAWMSKGPLVSGLWVQHMGIYLQDTSAPVAL